MTDVEKIMNALGCSQDEAMEIVEEDKRIDKLTPAQVKEELGKEDCAIIKSMTKAREKKPAVYQFAKRERKSDNSKSEIISAIADLLNAPNVSGLHCADVEITNAEREINFTRDGRKFKIVLSAPRK